MLLRSRSSRVRLTAGLAGVVLAAAACSSGGTAKTGATTGKVTLTFWSWVPHLQSEVALFEKAHPNIKVNLVNAGQGAAEYTKLRTALKAGSGAPDVVQVEFQYLPTFEQIHGLVDISKYGANSVKSDFVPWAWSQVSRGSAVYAIPQDSGPMGLLYRKDIFDKYHIAVPTTWTQFAQAAAKLHAANPNIYLTDLPTNDPGWFNGLLWQAGAQLFHVSGTTISASIDQPAAIKVADYWGNLVQRHLVATDPDFASGWYSGLAKGKYAAWVTAAWGPVFLSGVAGKTAGKWRAAPIPQWTPGATVSANWGGSTDAVTTQAAHPQQAAELAMWINSNSTSAQMLASKSFLFPTQTSLLSNQTFANAKPSFYGGQQVNKIFIDSSQHVNLTFQWSPFQDYFYSQMGTDLGQAVNGTISFADAMHKLQGSVVSYAKAQGFTVSP
jgi:multiple sugar transport system substrate-binding protein